jgi:hypothetical protein
MSSRPSTVTVCIAAILGCLLGIITFARADDPPETYQQILAKRPPPELDALSERSAPDQQGETASESFLDLLKLREAPLRAAVPQLAEILAAHADSTRIHGFAAAQALYTADTDEARRVLEKHLLKPEYRADLAVMYASHWEMREPQRSRFIATYLLRDLSEDLAVSVHPRWGADGQKTLFARVELGNASKRPLAILLHPHFQAMALYVRSPSGIFVEKQKLIVYRPERPLWHLLKPGESTSFEVVLELKDDPESLEKFTRLNPKAAKTEALLTSLDVGFALGETGEFTLHAMIVQTPLSDEQLKFVRDTEGIETETIWTGRAVSEPVKVKLRLAERKSE